MKVPLLIALVATARVTLAHFSIFGVWINGQWQGDGREIYERTKFNVEGNFNPPLRNPDWPYIACGTLGHRERPKYLEVKAGDTLAPEWYWTKRGDWETTSHVGPLTVHMAPAVSTGPNTPDIWTKLFHYGYNVTDGLWADEYFQKDATTTKGHHFIKIPDVPAGNYLIRSDVIALQSANVPLGTQFYPSCVQIRVTSDGKAALPGGVSFPGSYKSDQPGIIWDFSRDDPAAYPIPGGEVWEGSLGGGIYGVNA
ncbi:glycoside hydrolase [Coprinopsis sp. MPI-PUGE-AT-0042]|nr:glycoside hydrolase [Coprinopsis sp. MPI-PUGE-AT-0042]